MILQLRASKQNILFFFNFINVVDYIFFLLHLYFLRQVVGR